MKRAGDEAGRSAIADEDPAALLAKYAISRETFQRGDGTLRALDLRARTQPYPGLVKLAVSGSMQHKLSSCMQKYAICRETFQGNYQWARKTEHFGQE